MSVIIQCPKAGCGKSMRVAKDAAGKRVRCPACKEPLTVPSPAVETAADSSGSRWTMSIAPSQMGDATQPGSCPACGVALHQGASACVNCGFVLRVDTAPVQRGARLNLCANSDCGVGNPPGERICLRCGE